MTLRFYDSRLLTFPNVLITSHQAFLTREALDEIADATIDNLSRHESGRPYLPARSWCRRLSDGKREWRTT